MDVIIENIETTVRELMLLVIGCIQVQGYALVKPMPVDQLPDRLQNYSPNQAWLQCADR